MPDGMPAARSSVPSGAKTASLPGTGHSRGKKSRTVRESKPRSSDEIRATTGGENEEPSRPYPAESRPEISSLGDQGSTRYAPQRGDRSEMSRPRLASPGAFPDPSSEGQGIESARRQRHLPPSAAVHRADEAFGPPFAVQTRVPRRSENDHCSGAIGRSESGNPQMGTRTPEPNQRVGTAARNRALPAPPVFQDSCFLS